MGTQIGGTGSPGRRQSALADINVTPLVDVMLVLLIIFMVTAPMLNAAVDLQLPQGGVTKVADAKGKLILSINSKRQLRLGDTPVKWTELFDKLSTNAKIQAEGELFLEADKDLPYGIVMVAMSIAKDAGAVKLQMVADPDAAKADLDEMDSEVADGAKKPKNKK